MSGGPLWYGRLTAPPGKQNRPADARFQGGTLPGANPLVRGQLKTISTGPRDMEHKFHFLTNPWEISTYYNVNSAVDLTNPNNAASVMSDLPPMLPDLISVSFSLLLDRQYEVWGGSMPEGVLHDIAQLERVLGMPDLVAQSGFSRGIPAPGESNGMEGTSAAVYSRFPGVIVKRPVRILFGGTHAFTFDGYITSLSVSFMKFSRNMAATRAGIALSAATWGTSEDGGSLSGGTGGTRGAGSDVGLAAGNRGGNPRVSSGGGTTRSARSTGGGAFIR